MATEPSLLEGIADATIKKTQNKKSHDMYGISLEDGTDEFAEDLPQDQAVRTSSVLFY